MRRACGVATILVLAGCGELAESRIERPPYQTAEEAARAQVEELFARGPAGHAELADLLRHPDVTGKHLKAVAVLIGLDDADGVRAPSLEVLAQPLVELAADQRRTVFERRSALIALNYLGGSARSVADRVWRLLEDEELFVHAWSVLMDLRWDPLVDVLARTLDADHRGHRLGAIRDLGIFGPAASRAVPALAKKLIDDAPFQERTEVVEALQKIGTPEAKAALVAALHSPRWRDVKHAIVAVLELSLFEAEPVLRQLSQRHWRVPIRRLAEVAANSLQRRRRGDSGQTNHIKFTGACLTGWESPAVVEYGGRRLQVPQAARDRRPQPPEEFPRTIDFDEDSRCVRDYARLVGGWAVAMDCGEWGGSVLFVSDEATTRVLSPMHSDEFVRFGDRLFAVGGLGMVDLGAIVELVRGSNGTWSALEIAQPIGTPHARLLTQEGLILVGEDGATLLRRDGTQEEVECVVPK